MNTANPVLVWGEIPVRDLAAAQAFYTAVFGFDIQMEPNSPVPQAILGSGPGVTGAHLYEGAPAAENGPILHMAVPGKVEAAIQACEKAGGTVTSDIITIPPGRFAYASDPDGNKLGLFEPG